MTMRRLFMILSLSLACAGLSLACHAPHTSLTKHSHQGASHQDAMAIVRDSLNSRSDALTLRALSIAARHNTRDFDHAAESLLQHQHPKIAGAAALYLHKPDSQPLEQVFVSLKSPNPDLRAFMIRGITKVMGDSARTLVLVGLDDESAKVRRAAVSSLTRLGHPADYPLLLKTASVDPSTLVRARALRGLLTQSGQDLDSLIGRSLVDEYIGTRLAAISLLDKFGGKDANEQLQRLAVPGDFPAALQAAVALNKRLGADNRSLLHAAMQSPDWEVRASALNAAVSCTDKTHAKTIATQASSDSHTQVKLAAARLHLRLGNNSEANTIFHQVIRAGALPDRLDAATELASHGDSIALALLSRLSLNGDTSERSAALNAQASARIVTDGLLASLGDPNPEIRLAAAGALLSQ